MDYEKAQGRNPVVVSKKGLGYDIESSGRMIEVKGVGESWKTLLSAFSISYTDHLQDP